MAIFSLLGTSTTWIFYSVESQMIWFPKIGRPEWILQRPELLHKKRICSEHFSKDMISGTRLKKDAFPNIFEEGVGEKGVNVNASTSASSSMDPENKENEDAGCEDRISPNICTTPEKKPGQTQTSSGLSSTTPRKRKLQYAVKNLKKDYCKFLKKKQQLVMTIL